MHKILQISLTAALISARLAGSAQAAYTESDIVRIEELISAGNWVDLRSYLLANPSLLLGDETFAVEMRKFLENTDSLYTALVFDQSMFPNISSPQSLTSDPVLPTAGTAPTEPGLVANLSPGEATATPTPDPQPAQATRSLAAPSTSSAPTSSSIY